MSTKLIEKVTRKTFQIRPSGRSTDFITPSFGHGCLYNCTYCYMKRHKPVGLDIATNVSQILTEVNNHCAFAEVEKPNQTHPEFITYDISCNEDFALHAKYHDWEYIFDFFKKHPVAMGSFATKYVNENLLNYNPEGKIRIRFSLMPQMYADFLEPKTSSINDRLWAVRNFINAGYEVHLNFSPVIVTPGWLKKYGKLFAKVNRFAIQHGWNNDSVKAEVIFLTHNEAKHIYNLENNLPGEDLLWNPKIQEKKVSQYGGANIRYTHQIKKEYIEDFALLHNSIIPWNTIRYCF
jgi:spore photoproduct lyase